MTVRCHLVRYLVAAVAVSGLSVACGQQPQQFAQSCDKLFSSALKHERAGGLARNLEWEALADHCPNKYDVLVDYGSIKRGDRSFGRSKCAEFRRYKFEPVAISLARKDGLCSAPRHSFKPHTPRRSPSGGYPDLSNQQPTRTRQPDWDCFYAPTYDRDWHNDVLCTSGSKAQRPYLRSWDSFVTEPEIMQSANEYERQLNR